MSKSKDFKNIFPVGDGSYIIESQGGLTWVEGLEPKEFGFIDSKNMEKVEIKGPLVLGKEDTGVDFDFIKELKNL